MDKRFKLKDALAVEDLIEFTVSLYESELDEEPEIMTLLMRRPSVGEVYAMEREVLPSRPVPDASNSSVIDVRRLPNGVFVDVYDDNSPKYQDEIVKWNSVWDCHRVLMCLPDDDKPDGETIDEQIEALQTLPNVYFNLYRRCATRAISGGRLEIVDRPFRGS